MRISRLGRLWGAIVLLPVAAAQAYGFAFEADVRTLTLFRVQSAWLPLWVWGVAWAVVAALSFVVTCCAKPWALRWAAIIGAAAGAGTTVASIWTRWGEGRPLTWVGLSWAYLVFAVFAMITISLSVHPSNWLEDDR